MWQNDVLRSDVLIVGVRWLPGWRGPRSNIGNCNYPALKRSPCLWFSYGAPSTCWREEECEQLEPHQMKILIVCLLNTTTVTNDGRQSLAIVDMSEQWGGMSRLGNTINICQDWNPNKKLSSPSYIVEIATLFYRQFSIFMLLSQSELHNLQIITEKVRLSSCNSDIDQVSTRTNWSINVPFIFHHSRTSPRHHRAHHV